MATQQHDGAMMMMMTRSSSIWITTIMRIRR